ncbi:hypothetical protein IMCC3317_41770 [Kordia antarctica]|uniref:Uncharacterized protein n=1 Tax=Kordia antarctica TaxID=1218801 RepID=A0A7L4ZQM8_9FLAO|nr:hypothetical protein IMCC3317_41770 [Kordia antarctica]
MKAWLFWFSNYYLRQTELDEYYTLHTVCLVFNDLP